MKNTQKISTDRRSFLKVTALAGGGLMFGLVEAPKLKAQGRGGPPAPAPELKNYIRFNADGTVTITAKNPKPADKDIDAAMNGNLCRCGTYTRIRRAVHRAAEMASAHSKTSAAGNQE